MHELFVAVGMLLLVGIVPTWLCWDIVRDHWHFMGHRVPGACCGDHCPHHRRCGHSHGSAGGVR